MGALADGWATWSIDGVHRVGIKVVAPELNSSL